MDVKPYPLMTCAEIREILNRRAVGEQELMEGIEEIERASIYYHTHSYYLKGKYAHDRYPNDFATWVADNVRDRVLTEHLAVIDPFDLKDVEALRIRLLTVIEAHLNTLGFSPRALFGEAFDFLRATVVVVPAGMEIRSRAELREAMQSAPPEVLYYHFFEDAFGKGRRNGSLVEWVAAELKDQPLADALTRINPYRMHLENLRARVIEAIDRSPEKT